VRISLIKKAQKQKKPKIGIKISVKLHNCLSLPKYKKNTTYTISWVVREVYQILDDAGDVILDGNIIQNRLASTQHDCLELGRLQYGVFRFKFNHFLSMILEIKFLEVQME
jgi:hypothetical protein